MLCKAVQALASTWSLIYGSLASLSSVIGVFDRSVYLLLSCLHSRRLSGIGVSICDLIALAVKATGRKTPTFRNLADVDLLLSELMSQFVGFRKLIQPVKQGWIVSAHESGAVVRISVVVLCVQVSMESNLLSWWFDLDAIIEVYSFFFMDLEKGFTVIHHFDHRQRETTLINPKFHLADGIIASSLLGNLQSVGSKHLPSLTAALTDFQKAQCFFHDSDKYCGPGEQTSRRPRPKEFTATVQQQLHSH